MFIKAPNTFIGHQQSQYARTTWVHALRSRTGGGDEPKPRAASPETDAMDYVAGYTVCNDYAIRDYLETTTARTCG